MTNLIRIHSQGKLSTLYEGATRLGKRVAVKQLSPELRENARLRDRVFQAARNWAALPHEYLLDYIDVDPEKGWIVTDWVPQSLAKLNPCPVEIAFRMLRQSLEALHHLNGAGFFHGNVKPSNLLIDSKGDVQLSDGFLLSIENPGVIPSIGSPKYLAPEMTGATSATPGPGIDLYALAFSLVEAMSGNAFRNLFPGISREADDHDMAWIQWHADPSATLPPTAEVVDCPAEFAVVIDRMLLKDPHTRYRFAEQVLADLPTHIDVVEDASATQPDAPNLIDNRVRHDHDKQADSEVSVKDVIPRPRSPVVVVLASGPNAGHVTGIDSPSFDVGFSASCDIPLENDVDLGDDDQRLHIQRGTDGWSVEQIAGSGFFVNQTRVAKSSVLRSGDIVRLSYRGPDFQFYLQSGTPSISEVAEMYLPSGKRRRGGQPTRRGPQAAAGAENNIRKTRVVSDAPAADARFTRPVSFANPAAPAQGASPSYGTAQPRKPAAPQRPATAAPQAPAASRAPQAPAAPRAPQAPAPRAPAAPQAPVAPGTPQAPAAPSAPRAQPPLGSQSPVSDHSQPAAADPGVADSAGIEWTKPKTWDKATRDKVMIGTAVVIAILAVLLFPTGRSEPDNPSETEAAITEPSQGETPPTAPNDNGSAPGEGDR